MAEFEALYQGFMTAGGFTQKTISEDVERRHRQSPAAKQEPCPHGRTRLTCHECYFAADWRTGR